MTERRSVRLSSRAALAAGAAAAALLCGSSAFAARPSEADARIARLEAAVASLQAQEKAHPGKSPRLSLKRPGAGARRGPKKAATTSLGDDEVGPEAQHGA